MKTIQQAIQRHLADEQSFFQRQKPLLQTLAAEADRRPFLEDFYERAYAIHSACREKGLRAYQAQAQRIGKGEGEAACFSLQLRLLRIHQIPRPSEYFRLHWRSQINLLAGQMGERIGHIEGDEEGICADLDAIWDLLASLLDPPLPPPSWWRKLLREGLIAVGSAVTAGTGVWWWMSKPEPLALPEEQKEAE